LRRTLVRLDRVSTFISAKIETVKGYYGIDRFKK